MRNQLMRLSVVFLIYATGGFCYTNWPNEPAGSTLLTDFTFDAKDGNGWSKVYTGGAIVQDPTAPASAPNALQYTWRHGLGPGDISQTTYNLPSGGTRELYVGLWWKMSNPFTGWGHNQNKLTILWNDGPDAVHAGKAYLFGFEGQQGVGPYRRVEWLNYPQNECQTNSGNGDCPGSYNLRPNVNSPVITQGQWHRMEFYGKIGSCETCNDGIWRTWMDGVLLHDIRNFNYPGKFTRFVMTPVWDNVETNFPNAVDHHWFDQARISMPNGAVSPTGPAAPTNLIATAKSSSQIDLSWKDNSTNETGFDVERRVSPTGTWNKIGSVGPNVSSYSATGQTTGHTFYFRVRAANAGGLPSGYSNVVSAVATASAIAEGRLTVNGLQLTARPGMGKVLFQMPQGGAYSLSVCDLSGREVWQHAGSGDAVWNHNGNLKKGVYLVRAEQNRTVKKATYCHLW